jgi:hypothetical protein
MTDCQKLQKMSNGIAEGELTDRQKIVGPFKNAQKWPKLTVLGVVSGPRRAQPKINRGSQ